MKLLVCAIYDNAVGAYMQPFFTRNKMEAIRSFSDAVGKTDAPFCAHPEDYTLFALGEYDDVAGSLLGFDVPNKIITALECVNRS